MKIFKRICDNCSAIHEGSIEDSAFFKSITYNTNNQGLNLSFDLCSNCYHKEVKVNFSVFKIIKETNEA